MPQPANTNLVLVSDGACRGSTQTSAASWAILAFTKNGIHLAAGGAIILLSGGSSLDAELTGFELALGALLNYHQGQHELAPHSADKSFTASELLSGNENWLALP